MTFHLDFKPSPSIHKIDLDSKLLLLGSCFTENIGIKLTERKFTNTINPFGNVFNPISNAVFLTRVLKKHYYTDSDVFENESKWFCFDTHTLINFNVKDDLIEFLNNTLDEWHEKLENANFLFITFGTGYYYTLLKTNAVVANCHKLPSHNFKKELIDLKKVLEMYTDLLLKLKQFNPNLKIVFTVSPVKHLKDGVVENVLSKSSLICVVHQLVAQSAACFYFPAYELVTEDLRDYRFYKEDLAHPNQLAINYVWDNFKATYFDDKTCKLVDAIEDIVIASQHKPFDENSNQHKKFKENYINKCKQLILNNKNVNLDKELLFFSQ